MADLLSAPDLETSFMGCFRSRLGYAQAWCSDPRSYGKQGRAVQSWLRILVVTVAALLPPAQPAWSADPLRIVVLGDSLSAGLGLPANTTFPEVLQRALAAQGRDVQIVNAGVSGDTTSDGLARLDWSIPAGTDAVIVELGANDALRGIDPNITRKALDGILRRLKERGLAVLLAGMQAPRNMGPDYVSAFDAIFPALAAGHGVIFYPFFLDGVATDPKLNQGDGMHPNAAGVAVIVERILPKVQELLDQVQAKRK